MSSSDSSDEEEQEFIRTLDAPTVYRLDEEGYRCIHATDFKKWEGHEYILAGLNNLWSAKQAAGPTTPVTFWMINAPVAVAAAAALNLPRIRIQKNSRLICAFKESNLWEWVGCAVDLWATSSGPIVSTVPRGSIVHLMQQGLKTDRSGLPQCTVYPVQSVTLSIFVHLRISYDASPGRGWLLDKIVPRLLITRREEAMEKGKEVLAKLGSEHHDQAALREPLDKWLTPKYIHVLPRDVKDRLWLWCLRHPSLWQPYIEQASEDSTKHHEVVYSMLPSARLASHDLRRCLDGGRCLVLLLEDRVSRSNLDMIVYWMQSEHEEERRCVSSEVPKEWKKVTDDLKSKLSPERLSVQSPQEPLFAGPRNEAHREVLIIILQQIFDASTCVSPKCPYIVYTWLALLPRMDGTLLPNICLDTDKAKERRASAKQRPWRGTLDDDKFSEMAAMINKIDPESLLIAYIVSLACMPQILGKKGFKMIRRCLEPYEAASTTSPEIVFTRKRKHSEVEH